MNRGLHDPILGRFRAALDLVYGERIERVVLFGSRARGDYRADSDYDVAVFLRAMVDWWAESRPLADITTDILIDTGAVISAKAFHAGSYDTALPFMREVQKDGVDI